MLIITQPKTRAGAGAGPFMFVQGRINPIAAWQWRSRPIGRPTFALARRRIGFELVRTRLQAPHLPIVTRTSLGLFR
jgi:hypothetical protein